MSDHHIPDELLREMLSRLQVKPLLRFRCVSESWKALIDSPHFIKLHLAHSQKTISNHTLILRYSNFYSADYDSLNKTNCAKFEKLNHPLKRNSDISTRILGSCNGLLCVMNNKESIVLWNPSTRKYKKLPIPEAGFYPYISYGFGYDCLSYDHKIVQIVRRITSGELYSEVRVYSLRSNSWKRLQDFPYFIPYIWDATLANGALHWIMRRKSMSVSAFYIVAFDLGTEEYRLVPQPECSDENFMTVGVLGGCLCFLPSPGRDRLDMWVMKEYGVKESWIKLISIGECDFYAGDFYFVRPIAYSKCGRRILLEQDNKLLLWYDLEKKSIRYVEMWIDLHPRDLFFQSHICSQSLVHLHGSSYCIVGKAGRKEEKQERKLKKSLKRGKLIIDSFHNGHILPLVPLMLQN